MSTFRVYLPITVEEGPVEDFARAVDSRALMFRVEADTREEAAKKFHTQLESVLYGPERRRIL